MSTAASPCRGRPIASRSRVSRARRSFRYDCARRNATSLALDRPLVTSRYGGRIASLAPREERRGRVASLAHRTGTLGHHARRAANARPPRERSEARRQRPNAPHANASPATSSVRKRAGGRGGSPQGRLSGSAPRTHLRLCRKRSSEAREPLPANPRARATRPGGDPPLPPASARLDSNRT